MMETRIWPTKAEEVDKQFWRQCKCGQGQFLVPLTTDGAISRPVKSRIGKGQPLMVVAGPAESNYERGLKMASCNDERRWVKRWRKGLALHCDQQLPTSAPKLSGWGEQTEVAVTFFGGYKLHIGTGHLDSLYSKNDFGSNFKMVCRVRLAESRVDELEAICEPTQIFW